jgi:hypothetical protein
MKNIITILSAFIIIVSCSDDFLDRKPLDQVDSSTFYRTEEDAFEALVAVYDALGYQSSPGVSWAPFLTVADILSDDAYAGGADANDGLDENEMNTFNIPPTNLLCHSIWLKNYTGIYRANLLLEKLPGIPMDEDKKARMAAECKFMRAYFHLELVRFFENIPLLTRTLSSPSEYTIPQDEPSVVYNQIALDLFEAAQVLPDEVPAGDLGRITKWAAQGLLGRVYLFYNGIYGMELQAGSETLDKSKVLELLEDIINNSSHGLLTDYNDIFSKAFEFSEESIFEISHGDSPPWFDWNYLRGAEGNLAAQMQGPRVTGSDNWDRGWSFAPVTYKLFQVLENDPRREATIVVESELDGTLVKGYQHTGYYSRKYTSDAEHWGSDGQFEHNRTCNFRVLRYADVLLMAAELGSPNAQTYLDDVRGRVGLASVPATQENIMRERRLELALEGVRYFDLLRQGLSVAADALNDQSERGPLYTDDQVVYEVSFNEATRGFLPIPQAELDLSGGQFQQNQGY